MTKKRQSTVAEEEAAEREHRRKPLYSPERLAAKMEEIKAQKEQREEDNA